MVLWVGSWSNKHASIHSLFALTVDGTSCSNFLCADLSSMRDWDLVLGAETSSFFHTLLSVWVFLPQQQTRGLSSKSASFVEVQRSSCRDSPWSINRQQPLKVCASKRSEPSPRCACARARVSTDDHLRPFPALSVSAV